jgi:hypothetical protein
MKAQSNPSAAVLDTRVAGGAGEAARAQKRKAISVLVVSTLAFTSCFRSG